MAKQRKTRDSSVAEPAGSGALSLYLPMLLGDNRTARSLARQALAQPSLPEQERAIALDVVARTGCDRAILATGLAAALAVATLIVWLYLV
ncbi:MAG: hypothetical protein ACOX6T_16070 [Myxococcales bacterium]|jgi:hypothetical protein